MAEIFDKGNSWELVINPSARVVETIDEPDKGYHAIIGHDDMSDKHVVMMVNYHKDKYSLDDVHKKVEQLRTCGRCNTLDKDKLNIDAIHLNQVNIGGDGGIGVSTATGASGSVVIPPAMAAAVAAPSFSPAPMANSTSTPAPSSPSNLKNPAGFKDAFANLFFDAYLTRPGMYFLGSMLGDDAMIDRALPRSEKEMGSFIGEMVDFFAGEKEFFRSPEEAKEHLAILRGSGEEEDGNVKKAAIKKKGKVTPGIVIY